MQAPLRRGDGRFDAGLGDPVTESCPNPQATAPSALEVSCRRGGEGATPGRTAPPGGDPARREVTRGETG